jgi:hypothetical protein
MPPSPNRSAGPVDAGSPAGEAAAGEAPTSPAEGLNAAVRGLKGAIGELRALTDDEMLDIRTRLGGLEQRLRALEQRVPEAADVDEAGPAPEGEPAGRPEDGAARKAAKRRRRGPQQGAADSPRSSGRKQRSPGRKPKHAGAGSPTAPEEAPESNDSETFPGRSE